MRNACPEDKTTTVETVYLIDVTFRSDRDPTDEWVEPYDAPGDDPADAVRRVAERDWHNERLSLVVKVDCVGTRVTTTTVHDTPSHTRILLGDPT